MRSYSDASAAALVLAALSLNSACSGPSLEVLSTQSARFLARDGDALRLDGKAFRFLSFNAFTLTGCGGQYIPTDREMDAFFASLRPRSVVRVYAFEPLGVESVVPVVASAKAHGHLLTLVLTDHSSSCGEGEQAKTTDWYASGFRDTYLPWVRQVVSRFANEPTVGFWEPVKGPRDVDAPTLRTFYDVIGGDIRRLDPNHLIEPGTNGPWAYGGTDGYRQIIDSAGIDVASFLTYDDVSPTFPSLEDSLVVTTELAKPLVAIEASLYASKAGDSTQTNNGFACVSFIARKNALAAQFASGFATRLAGVQVWNWEPIVSTNCAYVIGNDDPTFELVRTFPLP